MPDGYEPLYIGRNPKHGDTKWGNPEKMNGQSAAERKRVIQAFNAYFRGDGAHLRKDLEDLTGKVLQCHCAPLPCHGDVLIDKWWVRFGKQADEESKRRRKREQAQPYERTKMSERVSAAMALEEPERIFGSLVVSSCVNILYGYQNVGKSSTAEVIAIVAASGKTIEGVAIDKPRKRKVLVIDLEQPLISQKKWAKLKPLLDELGIEVVALGDKNGPPDRDRIWATCRQAALDGFDLCIIDNLNKYFQGDVTKKDVAERELNDLHETVFSHFETNVGIHHTTKLGTGPLESVPEMAGSAQIANYIQGNLVFVARSFRDPEVLHFHHFKSKFGHFMKIYEGETQLALRRVGFDTDWLPFEFVSDDQSFRYWQSELTSKDDRDAAMWDAVQGLSKKDAAEKLVKLKYSVNDRSARGIHKRLTEKFGKK